MRKLLLSLLTVSSLSAAAQTVSTFESLTLPGLDTAYVNYTQPGQDVGFSDGLAYFPTVYDTASFGRYWAGGFAYSNERDTATASFTNEYAAKTGSGFGGSQKYVVFFEPFGGVRKLRLTGAAQSRAVRGFYITNTTYAYGVMKNGDPFTGPRFGDTSATDTVHARPDFLKVVARGYRSGAITSDSAVFYLADFRATSSANDYIVKDWQWFSLLPLGAVDSLDFQVISSRIGSFGDNVPGYFAMDNFTTDESGTDVRSVAASARLRIYPNPATSFLVLESPAATMHDISVVDAAGRLVLMQRVDGIEVRLNTSMLTPGVYQLRVRSDAGLATHRFIKQ
jgi:hypothetical protein